MSTTKTKRQYRSAKEWQVLLEQFDQSELSQSEFCRQHSLTLSAFHDCKRSFKHVSYCYASGASRLANQRMRRAAYSGQVEYLFRLKVNTLTG